MPSCPRKTLITVAALATGLTACRKTPPTPTAGGRGAVVPVAATKVVAQEMPVVLRAIGNVRPSATVSIKPRVGGIIASVQFQEGQEVKAGDVLFTIDPKPYEVALAQARAALAQVQEGAENAQQQAKRYSSLGKSGAVAREQLDQVTSTAKASAAGSEAAEAALKEAQIQLGYTNIRAPISGRTGRRLIDAGNVVIANTTELVVVNALAPIEVLFAPPEQFLSEINRYSAERKLRVWATPTGKGGSVAEGVLSFVDNTVKQTSGTIDVKATFPNENFALWPGQFVDVTLELTTEKDALVIPAPAVQTGQHGQYVFVIKADATVEMRPVEMTRTVGNEAVISTGLAEGELIVTDGHVRLSPGAKVEVKRAPGSAPENALPITRAGDPQTKAVAAKTRSTIQ